MSDKIEIPEDFCKPKTDLSSHPFGYSRAAINAASRFLLDEYPHPNWFANPTTYAHGAAMLVIGIPGDLANKIGDLEEFGEDMEFRFWATLDRIRRTMGVPAKTVVDFSDASKVSLRDIVELFLDEGWPVNPVLIKQYYEASFLPNKTAQQINDLKAKVAWLQANPDTGDKAPPNAAVAQSAETNASQKTDLIILGLTAWCHFKMENEKLNLGVLAQGGKTSAARVAVNAIFESLTLKIDDSTVRERLISGAGQLMRSGKIKIRPPNSSLPGSATSS